MKDYQLNKCSEIVKANCQWIPTSEAMPMPCPTGQIFAINNVEYSDKINSERLSLYKIQGRLRSKFKKALILVSEEWKSISVECTGYINYIYYFDINGEIIFEGYSLE